MNKLKTKISIGALIIFFVIGTVISISSMGDKVTEKVKYDKSKLSNLEILSDFETTSVNPSKFKKEADTGSAEINILDKVFVLELHSVEIQDKDAVIIIEDERGKFIEKAPPIYGYRGRVKGKPDSKVTLTVADDVILGTIEADGKSYVIEQTNVKLENGKVLHIAYTSDMIKKRQYKEYNADEVAAIDEVIKKGQQEGSKELIKNIGINAQSTILATTTVTLFGAYDTEFQGKFSNPTAEISNVVNNVNNAYSPPGVTLSIKSYKKYTDISNSNACTVLGTFRAKASNDRDLSDSDLALLFSGKEFIGSAIGCSYGYSGANWAYAVMQMVSAGSGTTYRGSYTDRCILTVHESGHNFGAEHQGSGHAYANAYDWIEWVIYHDYTAMWTPYQGISYPNYMKLEFSNKNKHGDLSHDNVRRISETKNTVAGYQ